MFAISYYDWDGGSVNGVPAWVLLIAGVCALIAVAWCIALLLDGVATLLDRRANDRPQPGASPRR